MRRGLWKPKRFRFALASSHIDRAACELTVVPCLVIEEFANGGLFSTEPILGDPLADEGMVTMSEVDDFACYGASFDVL